MPLFLRLLAVLLLLFGGAPVATAGFFAACAPVTEEEHSERAETPVQTRVPARAETDSIVLEHGPRQPSPRWLTCRASTPSLAVRGARADRLSPLRC